MKQNIFKSESGNNRFSSANAINTINERRNDRKNNFFTEDRQKEREKERIKKENERTERITTNRCVNWTKRV